MKTTGLFLGILFAILLQTSIQAQSYRVGSGQALKFAGTSANEHVDLDTIINQVARTNFTVEFWENLDSATEADSDIPFICNKNWANGANTGFVISKYSTSTPSVWVNFTTSGATRFDMRTVPCPTLLTKWTHIAVTFNRTGSTPKVIVYINGLAVDSANFSTANAPTGTIANSNHTRLAQDGTGAYSWGFKYKGLLDEVRIWKSVRNSDEIKSNMCKKLRGTEANLLAYYTFDDITGTTLNNRVAGGVPGTLRNMTGSSTEWVKSGAPIGDTSFYVYNTSWSGVSLNASSTSNGNLTINNISGPVKGLQVYRVDSVPNSTDGLGDMGGNNVYYGLFFAETGSTATDVQYSALYNYSTYGAAASSAANIKLYNRYRNDYNKWGDIGATNNTTSRTFQDTLITGRRELMISDFSARSCANTLNAVADSIGANFVRLKWTSTGTQWQVKYGNRGFSLDSGRLRPVVTTRTDFISGLPSYTPMDFYVRNICGAGDTSSWNGPILSGTGDACPMPAGLTIVHLGGDSVKLMWTGSGVTYTIQYGISGFALGTGINVPGITGTSYVFTTLPVGSTLDFYILDSCSGIGRSRWFGPITYVVPTVSVNEIAGGAQAISVFPNPANNQLYIHLSLGNKNVDNTIFIYNCQGILVKTISKISTDEVVDIADLAVGLYTLQYTNNSGVYTTKFTVVR